MALTRPADGSYSAEIYGAPISEQPEQPMPSRKRKRGSNVRQWQFGCGAVEPVFGGSEAASLREYVETVAELLRVEPAATWCEHNVQSTAYVAMADELACYPDRLLMAEWSSDSGWCLALEPEFDEQSVILVSWPRPRRPEPVVITRRIRAALRTLTGLSHELPIVGEKNTS